MDPNAWQFRLAAQVPSNRFGISPALLEQAANLSGIAPQLASTTGQATYLHHANPSIDSTTLQSGLTAESLAKLQPLSNIQSVVTDPSRNYLDGLLKQPSTETPEPPPAHSGQRATMQQQNPYRARAEIGVTPAEQNLLMDHFESIRQQLQLLNQEPTAPKLAASIPSNAYHLTDSGRYADSQSTPAPNMMSTQQESHAVSKYPDHTSASKHSSNKYQHQNYVTTHQRYEEPTNIAQHQTYQHTKESHLKRQESARSKYEEVIPAHTKQVAQVKSGYSHNAYGQAQSPSSQTSSPHVAAHSSPNISYVSQSPQQVYQTAFNQQTTGNNYGTATTEVGGITYGGIPVSVYESVSPAAHQSVNQHPVQTYSSPMGQQVLSSGEGVVSAGQYNVQQQGGGNQQHSTAQIVQAQADSTTKPKKGRGSKGGRSQSTSSRGSKKKKVSEQTQQEEVSMQSQLIQQLQQPSVATSQQQQFLQRQVLNAPSLQSSHSPMPQLEHIQQQQAAASVAMTTQGIQQPAVASLQLQQQQQAGQQHMGSLQIQSLDSGQVMQPLYELHPADAAQYSNAGGGAEDSLMHQMHMANELLGINHNDIIKQEDQPVMFIQNLASPQQSFSAQLDADIDSKNGGTLEDNLGLGLSTLDYRKQKLKTKVEQKEIRAEQSVSNPFVDEEFGHLKPAVEATTAPKPTPKPAPKPIVKQDSSFQTSFLSFIQGNKQETLSSVTNSAIVKKPELPKYIPEPPRPRPKPKPEVPKRHSTEASKRASQWNTNGDRSRKGNLGFSSDEESSKTKTNAKKIVEDVLNKFNENAAKKEGDGAHNAPLKLKIKMSDISMPMGSKSKSKKRSSGGKSRKRSSGKSRKGDDEYEVVALDLGEDEGSNQGAKPNTPSPPPVVRQRSSRKAKEKVEEKRKKRQEKKKRKKSTEEGVDEEYVLSSDAAFDSEPEEKEYDSDRDPGWQPTVDDFRGSSGVSMKDVGMEPKRYSSSSGVYKPKFRGRVPKSKRQYASTDDEDYGMSEEDEPAAKKRARPTIQPPRPVVVDCDSDDNSPHHYAKGDFVMEKKELYNPEKFIIWKIDAGKLIQKYEPIVSESGTILHKPLSTYSSWSDILKPNYIGIEVESMRQAGGEVVVVREKYRPKQPDETLEKHAWMEAFNVFIQILLSEALEPGFLSLIRKPGEFDYYTGPLQQIEAMVRQTTDAMHTRLQWKQQFKDSLDSLPLLRVMDKRGDPLQHCQARTCEPPEVSCKEARLYGDVYNFETLAKTSSVQLDTAKLFCIGKTASEHVRRYHRLHHLKYRMYKKCLYRIECCRRSGVRETSDILDQCLQNRLWVQMLFSEFLKLMQDTPGSETKPPKDDAESPGKIPETGNPQREILQSGKPQQGESQVAGAISQDVIPSAEVPQAMPGVLQTSNQNPALTVDGNLQMGIPQEGFPQQEHFPSPALDGSNLYQINQ